MNEEKKPPILVNGEEVRKELIEQELQMLRERYGREMSYSEMEEQKDKIQSDARENAVERVLLQQKARVEITAVRPEELEARFAALQRQHGGPEEFFKRFELSDKDLEQIKADVEDGLRLEKYFDAICRPVERPGEADARAYYEEHIADFKIPESVHVMHIVQQPSDELPMENVYADLLNIRERLLNGESFETLAQEHTHCQGGNYDLGYFARGQMVPAFEEVAFNVPVGGISDVFLTEFGYHILTVIDRQEETLRTFDDVRYDIEALLFEERKNEAIGAEADRLRDGAEIQNLHLVDG